ncbi:MAG: DUF2461 domain-containing protein [Candidatus Dormibacter sp.]
MDRFTGWPKPALTFLKGLHRDNSKAYFEAHREVYETACKEPMLALIAELEQQLGSEWEGKMFRINRDLRFSKDKRPYKETVSAVFTSSKHATGHYLQLSHDALYIGTGGHEMPPDQLARYRDAVAGKPGEKLAQIFAALHKKGYDSSEPILKRVPGGYPSDHPRAELLRAGSAWVNRTFKPAPWFHTPQALTRIREAWQDAGPLSTWLDTHVKPSSEPRRHR